MDDLTVKLKEEFERQAEWRREKAAEYPDDKRNMAAAEKFDRLAATVKDIGPEILAAFNNAFGYKTFNQVELWQEMLREIGFHRDPQTAEELVREFLAEAQ